MELRVLHYFVTLAEELHFGRAAQRLCISQPPLSVAIRQLEEELQVRLFNRTTRKLSPTEHGRVFYEGAVKIIEAVNEAEAAIARANADHGGRVVTTIEGPAPWYPAEDYHQEYWEGEGQRNPYCMAVIPPKLAKLRKGFSDRLRTA